MWKMWTMEGLRAKSKQHLIASNIDESLKCSKNLHRLCFIEWPIGRKL